MRRFKQGVAILAIATMVLMTACGKKTVTTPPLPTTTEVTSEADVITTDITTEATSETTTETTTEASTEESSPEETTPEANSEEVTTTVKQTEAATTQATTTAKQTEAPTTVKQTEAPTTAKQTEAPTTVKQTEAPTTAKQTEPATTEEATTTASIEYISDDVIKFGNYKGHDLTWTILLKSDSGIYAICNNVVDRKQYNTTHDPNGHVYYRNSSLKKWLENDFLNAAFTSKQQEQIQGIGLSQDEQIVNGLLYFDDFYDKCVCKPILDLEGNSSDFWIETTWDVEADCYFCINENGRQAVAESGTLVKGVRPEISIKL